MQDPSPFRTKCDHSFFKDFTTLKYCSSIRPGRKVGDPTVTDLKAIKYNPEGFIEFKLRHTIADWTPLSIRVININTVTNYKNFQTYIKAEEGLKKKSSTTCKP